MGVGAVVAVASGVGVTCIVAVAIAVADSVAVAVADSVACTVLSVVASAAMDAVGEDAAATTAEPVGVAVPLPEPLYPKSNQPTIASTTTSTMDAAMIAVGELLFRRFLGGR